MSKLPLDLELTLSDNHVGALQAKFNILEIRDKLREVDCSSFDSDLLPNLLLEHRTEIIKEIVKRLGQLTEFQKGYITALLEFSEASEDGSPSPEWQPSVISGKWQ